MTSAKFIMNKRKIIQICDQSWENTCNPTDPTIAELPRHILLLMGEIEIFGYIEACQNFNIIDKKTATELRENYHLQTKKTLNL